MRETRRVYSFGLPSRPGDLVLRKQSNDFFNLFNTEGFVGRLLGFGETVLRKLSSVCDAVWSGQGVEHGEIVFEHVIYHFLVL